MDEEIMKALREWADARQAFFDSYPHLGTRLEQLEHHKTHDRPRLDAATQHLEELMGVTYE